MCSVTTLARAAAMSIAITVFAATVAAGQILVQSTPNAPQAADASIPTLAAGWVGKNIWITVDGTRVRGRVTTLNTTTLVIVENGRLTTIPYSRIARVEKSTHRIRNGMLIGAAAGAGAMLPMAFSCGGFAYPTPTPPPLPQPPRLPGPCIAGMYLVFGGLWGGIGAAAGGAIGAVINADRKNGSDLLYDARRNTRTIAFTPTVSPQQMGLTLKVAWR